MSKNLELENYCLQKNPVGAILLSGEWGCGKTYYIEHTLKPKLNDRCVFIRISLFGISSIEELNKFVKKSWITEYGKLLNKAVNLEKFKPFFEKIIKLIPDPTSKAFLEGFLTIDFFDSFKIENTIDEKNVILVFDDFERSQLDIHEKLGVINEYCENQHFNVIVVADENQLSDDEFKKFKEKTIERTIKFTPNYGVIVENVINEIEDEEYKSEMLKKKKYTAALFAGKDIEGNSLNIHSAKVNSNIENLGRQQEIDQEERRKRLLKSRPHNIRSLKIAIRDFKRIYDILIKNGVSDIDKWFYSFLSYVLASKANLINDHQKYGNLFKDSDLVYLYPGFYNSRYMPDCIKRWVDEGVWIEGELEELIYQRNYANRDVSPKDQVKDSSIVLLDESIAIQGLKDILEDAYNGQLTMNQYVNLIINSWLVREYELEDLHIDWKKVQSGIHKRKDICIQNGIKQDFVTQRISDLEKYSVDEKETYALIKDIVDNSLIMYGTNKQEYIQAMCNSADEAFMKVYNLSFNCFDNDMADATVDAFNSLDNVGKARFVTNFKGMWVDFRDFPGIDQKGIDKSVKGFNYLKIKLYQLKEEYHGSKFKMRFTQNFIDVIDELIGQNSTTLDI